MSDVNKNSMLTTKPPKTVLALLEKPRSRGEDRQADVGLGDAAGPASRRSGTEASAIILRRGCQQAQKAAAHGFFGAEAAALRYPFHRQARLRQKPPRRLHAQPFDGMDRRQSGGLDIAPAETSLAHPGLAGEDRKRDIVGQMI